MKTRRLLTMLLALMLMVSVFAVTASAEEEMDYSPYLCFSWLDNWGDGWFENTDRDWYHDNRGMGMTPLEDRWLKFYAAEWNGSDWAYTPIDPAELVVENLTVTPFRDLPAEDVGDVIPGHDPKYFCRVNANDWGDASVSYTMPDGTELTMGVSVQRNEAGFYSSMILNNDTYINQYRIDPFAEENSFYFGFQSTYWTLKEVELRDDADQFVTLEPTNKRNVYKITVKPEVAENIWNIGGFDMRLDVTVYNDDDPENYQEEVWNPGIWCDPVWYHEADWDASIVINGDEYLIAGDVVLRNYFVGTDSDDEGNTWDVWAWEKTELPKGVSYDVASNTLTLNNAQLTQLALGWHWVDEWSGEEYWNLPSQDLTIELIGANSIVCDWDWALGLHDEVKTTITGDGSLYVKATNEIQQDENGNYRFYPALDLGNGEGLTIEGNANVTVEIAGEGMDGNDEWNQPANLIAFSACWKDVTLRENAVLTTVVPEDGMSNGAVAPNPDDPWHRPGGYRGITDVNCLTIEDNATLNTTTLDLNDHWEWDEETETDYIVGGSTLIMNGGTLNVTALPSLGAQENWQWNEETQEDEFLGYSDVYGYAGINMGGKQISIHLNGGVVNITAIPRAEHMEAAWCTEGLNVWDGEMTMNGGEINIVMPDIGGDNLALCVGDWGEDRFGKLTMNGGEIRINGEHARFEVAPRGEAKLLGGSITIPSGELIIHDGWEWNEELQEHERVTFGTMLIDGTRVTMAVGSMNNNGDLTINSGGLFINRTGDPNRHPDDIFAAAWNHGTITVNGGDLAIECTDVNEGLSNQGDFHQTGGSVAFILNETDEWRRNHMDAVGYLPTTYAFQGPGNLTIDGGFFVGYGHYGITIYPDENGDNKFVVNGGEVLGNGEMNGIMLFRDAEFNGGMVRAISRGRQHTTYNGETGEPVEFYAGNAIVLTDGVNLTINGGDHRLEGYINEGYPKATTGISLYFTARAAINGGSIRIAADMAMVSNDRPDQGNPFTLAEDMVIYSMHDGGRPSFIEYADHPYVYGEDGNPLVDEDGNYIVDETVFTYDYWLEEDGVYEGGEEEIPDWSTDVVVTSEKCGDDATWSLENGVLTVSGTGAIYDYTDHLFSGIAPWMWLHDNNLIKTIVLDEGITAIGDFAFWHRDEVNAPVEVAIGVNVTAIGKQAFASDAVLTVVCKSAGETYAAENGFEATVLHQFTNGKCTRCGFVMETPFGDVPTGSFYFDPVVWAVENGVTTGASAAAFNPAGQCLRAQVVTFLYRADQIPEPAPDPEPFPDLG